MKSLSHIQLFVTPWTVAYEAPPSMGFSRQEYWSVLPFPSPGDLPNARNELESPALQADTIWATKDIVSSRQICKDREKEINLTLSSYLLWLLPQCPIGQTKEQESLLIQPRWVSFPGGEQDRGRWTVNLDRWTEESQHFWLCCCSVFLDWVLWPLWTSASLLFPERPHSGHP